MLRRTAAAAGTLLALAVLGLVAVQGPFLRVDDVRVSGLEGEQAPQVRRALQDAAHGMPALRVDEGALRTAVARYSSVEDLEVEADLPKALRIAVRERIPVARLGGVAVDARGRPMRGVPAAGLPAVPGSVATDPGTRRLVALVAAAAPELRARVSSVRMTSGGPEALLRDGPALRFGDWSRPRAKWLAASAVLADERAAGATYLDLRLPERPAAGGEPPSPSSAG
jgi:cell division protein FtsQ